MSILTRAFPTSQADTIDAVAVLRNAASSEQRVLEEHHGSVSFPRVSGHHESYEAYRHVTMPLMRLWVDRKARNVFATDERTFIERISLAAEIEIGRALHSSESKVLRAVAREWHIQHETLTKAEGR
jgi:hypothetical protein